ncbi:MAG: SurA N-terminal domain-containing protein [Nitrospiraceae bacterium]|nr:SurA N-terminal domain-containing protein [Nitrospiraceae bacterium]
MTVLRMRVGVVLLALLIAAGVAGAELLDRVLASVNNDVICLSDLRQAMAFNTAVSGVKSGRRMEEETLEGLINRKLLFQEALRLHIAEVTDQDVASEMDQLRTRLGGDEAYRAFLSRSGLTDAGVKRMLGERLLVERFVEKKISLFARVTRDEAQDYFAAHAGEYPGKRFAEVQAQITAMLAAQKTGQQLDLYVEELRGRATIRKNPLSEGGAGDPAERNGAM